MNEIKMFIDEKAVGEGFLHDWYIHSVMDDDPPVWTEEHIAEMCGDFYIIPKESVEKLEDNEDCCVWIQKDANKYDCKTHAERYDSRVSDWHICPYCCKKIKIVE